MKKLILALLCGVCLISCGGGGGDEAEIKRVTEQFIEAYNDASMYTLQGLCANSSLKAFDLEGEVNTEELVELVRASGSRSSYEILNVEQNGKKATVTVKAEYPDQDYLMAALEDRLPLMTVGAYNQSEAEMDRMVIEAIISILRSPKLKLTQGEHEIRLVYENGYWKLIPEFPPFYTLND